MNRNTARRGLKLPCGDLKDRKRETFEYSTSSAVISDEEGNAQSPAFDSLYGAGVSEGIMKMVNLKPANFRTTR